MKTPVAPMAHARSRRLLLGLVVMLAVVGLLAWPALEIYRRFGPTHWNVCYRFIDALNRNDWDDVFELTTREERILGPVPTRGPSKAEMLGLLQNMDPPFPQGVSISHDAVEMYVNPDGISGGGAFRLIDAQGGPGRTGAYPNTFVIALARTDEGWQIRPGFTFWRFFINHYGEAAGDEYLRRYRRLVLQGEAGVATGRGAVPK